MARILTLTLHPAVDLGSSVDRVVPERKLRCAAPQAEPGGGGLNVARAVRELGEEALAWYLAGGPTGEMLQELLAACDVPQKLFPTAGATRQNLAIEETSTGQQFRFQMPGADVQDAEWRRMLDELRGLDPPPAYLVASGSLPPGVPTEAWVELVRVARSRGARVVLDTSGAPLRAAVAAGGLHVIKPNMRELGDLVGRERLDDADVEAAALDVVARGRSEIVLVSLGAAGALAVSKDTRLRVRAPTVPIRSKVGAGDSTVAGLVVALARGLPFRDAVRFGIAAGSAAVMTPGTELCRRADVERLYERLLAAS